MHQRCNYVTKSLCSLWKGGLTVWQWSQRTCWNDLFRVLSTKLLKTESRELKHHIIPFSWKLDHFWSSWGGGGEIAEWEPSQVSLNIAGAEITPCSLSHCPLLCTPQSGPGFLNSGTIDILSGIFLCYGGCLVCCRIFSCIPGLQLPDSSKNPPSHAVTATCLQSFPWEAKLPPFENHCSRQRSQWMAFSKNSRIHRTKKTVWLDVCGGRSRKRETGQGEDEGSGSERRHEEKGTSSLGMKKNAKK